MESIVGVFGKPFLNLDSLLDLSPLESLHKEITMALARLPVAYTGGSHRSLGIMPPSQQHNSYVDYGEVIASMTESERLEFVSLADELDTLAAADALSFGEERSRSLSTQQMLFLKYRYGVYFPWQVYFEMIPNHYWEDKASPQGKQFTRLAQQFFPRTIEFVRSLPFEYIGRCNILGLDANHEGTIHRDGENTPGRTPDQFINLCPGPAKQLFVWDEVSREKVLVTSRSYWFNDTDYHGVEAAPYFRYSLRIDGIFREGFLTEVQQLAHRWCG